MFHYRPAISSRQFRIIIAAFAAIAAHITLISLTIDQKPDFAPHLSLPRSVNVFLGQNSSLPPENMAAKELQEKYIEVRPPVIDKVETLHSTIVESPVVKEPVKDVQAAKSSELTVKPVKEAPVKKIQVTQKEPELFIQQSLKNQKVSKPEAESPANKLPIGSRTELTDSPAGDGVQHPGAIQMAYPRYQFNSPPIYPGQARKRGQEGTVILQVLVNRDGKVEQLQIDVTSNFPILDRAAVKAVKKWIFEPGRRDKERVEMWVKVPVTFKLNE